MKKLSRDEVTILLHHFGHSMLEVLRQLGGYYKCPKDADGKRLGPLVGYNKRYDGKHQYVGDIYLNFAVLEEYPVILKWFAKQLLAKIQIDHPQIDVFCGAPMGGLATAMQLADAYGARYIYPEKETLEVKDADGREKTKLIWGRHRPEPGDKVAICEDLLNNFGTTEEMIDLIEEAGAHVVLIAGLYNRSLTIRGSYILQEDVRWYPVVALDGEPVRQFQQDDPRVASDIAAGNVVWKPKHDWPRLAEAMRQAEEQAIRAAADEEFTRRAERFMA